MSLKVVDATGAVQYLAEWVDNVYRFAGQITATQAAGTACDILLLTAAPTGTVTRLLWAKWALGGGGTATAAGGLVLTMNRVTAAPTGQTNVPVTGYPHIVGATAIGSTCNITPSSTQTAGTSPLQLGHEVFDVSLLSTGGDKLQASRVQFACGPEARQQPLQIPAGGFLTFRLPVAAVGSSVIHFDIGISEAST